MYSGTRVTEGLAHVYDDEETALELEPEYIIERNRIEEEEPQRVEEEEVEEGE
jgi:ribosomal protein S24E